MSADDPSPALVDGTFTEEYDTNQVFLRRLGVRPDTPAKGAGTPKLPAAIRRIEERPDVKTKVFADDTLNHLLASFFALMIASAQPMLGAHYLKFIFSGGFS